MTLYTRAVPLPVAKRIWDLYHLDGFPLLFKTALAILKIVEKKIIYQELEDVFKILKNLHEYIVDGDVLVNRISKIEIPDWVYN